MNGSALTSLLGDEDLQLLLVANVSAVVVVPLLSPVRDSLIGPFGRPK